MGNTILKEIKEYVKEEDLKSQKKSLKIYRKDGKEIKIL